MEETKLKELTIVTINGLNQAPLAGVTVTVTRNGSLAELQGKSDRDGECYFHDLPVGGYTISGAKEGYKIYLPEKSRIRFQLGENTGELILFMYKPFEYSNRKSYTNKSDPFAGVDPDEHFGRSYPYATHDIPTAQAAACLKMICEYYGKNYELDDLKEVVASDQEEGVSMLAMNDAAESLGFRTMGVKLDYAKLKEEVVLPCIIHWKDEHFVVVYGVKDDVVYVADSTPQIGRKLYSKSDFCKNWYKKYPESKNQGLALLMEPVNLNSFSNDLKNMVSKTLNFFRKRRT